MKDSALSVANYFVDKSLNGPKDLSQLKLMKLVYIAHGYMLAMIDRSVFNPKFDYVEAWKYGPVVPSVYHSFKRFRNDPITEKTIVVKSDDNINFTFEEPVLQDEDAKKICDYVWERYYGYSAVELVTLLHGSGTPWGTVYVDGMNNIIPDALTKAYYRRLVKTLLNISKNEE